MSAFCQPPHSVVVPLFGIGVWSRLPIVSGESVHFPKEKIPSTVATLDAPGGEIVLRGLLSADGQESGHGDPFFLEHVADAEGEVLLALDLRRHDQRDA